MPSRNISSNPERSRGRPSRKDAEVAPEEKLLRLALEVFAETGYEGTSIRQLTRQLGVSHGLLHARYGSKENLWQAAVDFGLEKLAARTQQRLADAPDGLEVNEKLRLVFEDFLYGVSAEPAILKLMNYEGSRSSPRLDYIASNFFQEDANSLSALMIEGVDAGLLRDVPANKVFFLMAHGAGAYLCLKPLAHYFGAAKRQTKTALRADIEELADMLLRSIKTEKA